MRKLNKLDHKGEFLLPGQKLMKEIPKSPPVQIFELIVVDFKGRELDPILEQASQKILSDDSFVKSRAFHQFSWRENMHIFEEKCKNMKAEHPEMDEASNQDQIKEKMMQEF